MRGDNVLKFGQGESGVEPRVLEVETGKFEAIFNRIAENETPENGGRGDGIK